MNDRMVIDQEAASVAACVKAAEAAGHTAAEAEECDDGSVGCPTCPWRKRDACREAAELNGISAEQAANCWEGVLECPTCPDATTELMCRACEGLTVVSNDQSEAACSECGRRLINPNFKTKG